MSRPFAQADPSEATQQSLFTSTAQRHVLESAFARFFQDKWNDHMALPNMELATLITTSLRANYTAPPRHSFMLLVDHILTPSPPSTGVLSQNSDTGGLHNSRSFTSGREELPDQKLEGDGDYSLSELPVYTGNSYIAAHSSSMNWSSGSLTSSGSDHGRSSTNVPNENQTTPTLSSHLEHSSESPSATPNFAARTVPISWYGQSQTGPTDSIRGESLVFVTVQPRTVSDLTLAQTRPIFPVPKWLNILNKMGMVQSNGLHNGMAWVTNDFEASPSHTLCRLTRDWRDIEEAAINETMIISVFPMRLIKLERPAQDITQTFPRTDTSEHSTDTEWSLEPWSPCESTSRVQQIPHNYHELGSSVIDVAFLHDPRTSAAVLDKLGLNDNQVISTTPDPVSHLHLHLRSTQEMAISHPNLFKPMPTTREDRDPHPLPTSTSGNRKRARRGSTTGQHKIRRRPDSSELGSASSGSSFPYESDHHPPSPLSASSFDQPTPQWREVHWDSARVRREDGAVSPDGLGVSPKRRVGGLWSRVGVRAE